MRRLVPGALLASALSAGLALFGMAPAGAAAVSIATGQTGPVTASPANTPQLNANGAVEQVRQLVQCGSTMYAVGTFTSIKHNSTVTAVNNAFSFSATAPYNLTTWAPDVNGIVNSIAFNGTGCADAYIGGKFTAVNGTKVGDLAEVSTTGTGALVTTFGHTANGQVNTLLGVKGHILAGGYYTTINGSTNKYMTSLNPTTGKDDGFVQLNISGNYQFPGVSSNGTRVYNQSLSNGGTLDLVMGDFTSVGGLPRQQIFMLNLATTPATVTGWTSPEWDGSQGEAVPSPPNNPQNTYTSGYPYECATVEPFYIQAAAWSPDDSTIYIGTTGYHPNGFQTGATPRNGLCDAAAAFPATVNPPAQNGQPGYVLHTWVNYAGCDSLYSAAADASTAYFGGHERWSENPNDCDAQGPGAISAPGFEGLSAASGLLTFNPTRARGLGADDMLDTSAGLWIASDNQGNGTQCAGKSGHAGICFLPYS
jgi:hypothetical protein